MPAYSLTAPSEKAPEKAPPETKPDKPGKREKTEQDIRDWIAFDCPLAGKTAIDDNLINLLVDRLVSGGEATPVLPLITRPTPPVVEPPPPKPELPPIKPPDLIQPKPPDLIKPPEKPIDPIKPEPTAKPKRGMESKTNHAIKRSKPKTKATKPLFKKPSKHK